MTLANKKSKSEEILERLKASDSRIAVLKLREQDLKCKSNILATQIHLKNIQLEQTSHKIITDLTTEGSPQRMIIDT